MGRSITSVPGAAEAAPEPRCREGWARWGPHRMFCSFSEAEVKQAVHSLGPRAKDQRALSCLLSL